MADDSRYPECDSKIPAPSAGDIGYIGSSESVGFGHNQSMNRLPSVGGFPNEESGVGQDPSNMDSPFSNG